MRREQVLPVAMEIWRQVLPACHKTKIAGSLRRECAEVGDVDLVVQPHRDLDLFEKETEGYGALDAALAELISQRLIALDPDEKKDGPRYKRFVIPQLDHLPLEIWIADHDNWGYILALRTGPDTLNHLMVTPIRQSGLCPNDVAMMGGNVWWFPSARAAAEARQHKDPSAGRKLSCPNEEAFWGHLRLPMPAPNERDAAKIAELVRLAAAGGLRHHGLVAAGRS